ncbi:aldo/keto reductase [Acidobacteriota bacterium]
MHKKKGFELSRRGFIKSSAAAAAGLGLMGTEKLAGAEKQPDGGKPKIREYRTLGRTGFKVSDISFGAGNLTNTALLEAALDMGVNYIDTAEHYARGNSERTVGQVMKQRDRKSVFITTKLNFRMGASTKDGLRKRFDKCMERLQLDYADCLMIHMTPEVDQIKHEPYHELIRELKAEGKVRYSGLSNHGTEHNLAGQVKDPMEKVMLAAAEDGRFDVTLFVYNFLQKEQGEKILRACKEKKMGTTLMKTDPVKFLSGNEEIFKRYEDSGRKLPERFVKMFEEYKIHAAKAEDFKEKYGLEGNSQVRDAAIKFCLNNPDVHAVCPTAQTFEELEAYIALSGQRLDAADLAMLSDFEDTNGSLYCRHACGSCEGACPMGVPVNSIMRYDHYFRAQRREKHAMEHYGKIDSDLERTCGSCAGYCQTSCPFGVPIQSLLMMAHETLSL